MDAVNALYREAVPIQQMAVMQTLWMPTAKKTQQKKKKTADAAGGHQHTFPRAQKNRVFSDVSWLNVNSELKCGVHIHIGAFYTS